MRRFFVPQTVEAAQHAFQRLWELASECYVGAAPAAGMREQAPEDTSHQMPSKRDRPEETVAGLPLSKRPRTVADQGSTANRQQMDAPGNRVQPAVQKGNGFDGLHGAHAGHASPGFTVMRQPGAAGAAAPVITAPAVGTVASQHTVKSDVEEIDWE